jgi:hypothetical protein
VRKNIVEFSSSKLSNLAAQNWVLKAVPIRELASEAKDRGRRAKCSRTATRLRDKSIQNPPEQVLQHR